MCISQCVTIIDVMQLMIWVDTAQESANIVMDLRKGLLLQSLPTCAVSTHIMSCMTSMIVTHRRMHFAKGTVLHSIIHMTVSHTTLTACACALQRRLLGVL